MEAAYIEVFVYLLMDEPVFMLGSCVQYLPEDRQESGFIAIDFILVLF